MDRIDKSIRLVQEPFFPTNFAIESGVFSVAAADSTCSLLGPLHYEPGYQYPLIVWLHGQGEDERQLLRVMPQISIRNYVAAGPRGLVLSGLWRPHRQGYGWEQTEASIQEAERRIFDAITLAAKKYHVHPRRIFLAGFDAGGTMAFRVAMSRPERFAGVLSLGGAFPRQGAPLGRLADARRLSVFLAVGRDSHEYPPSAACCDLRLFHTAGMSVMLRQYPCGHKIDLHMPADMDRWIIEQITSSSAAAVETDRPCSREVD